MTVTQHIHPATFNICVDLMISCARQSKAKDVQVGAVIVTKDDVLLSGYNGTPPGWDNDTEVNGVTTPQTIHAELNCVLKAARQGVSIKDAICFVTYAPCERCAAMLATAGIRRVFYIKDSKNDAGVKSLFAALIPVIKIELDLNGDHYGKLCSI